MLSRFSALIAGSLVALGLASAPSMSAPLQTRTAMPATTAAAPIEIQQWRHRAHGGVQPRHRADRRWDRPRHHGRHWDRPRHHGSHWNRGGPRFHHHHAHRPYRPIYRQPAPYIDLYVPGPRYVPGPYYAPRYNYRAARNLTAAHVNWCHNRYRSYRAYDNTFQPYNGPRRQCVSPYI
jgi:hypothetical protein